jgi:hypothetical protein
MIPPGSAMELAEAAADSRRRTAAIVSPFRRFIGGVLLRGKSKW